MKNDFCEEYEKAFPKAVECLEEDLKILFSSMPLRNWTVARHQAQTHRKGLTVKFARRSSVVGIFPSTDSYIRLITSYLLEYSEEWQTERCYINAGSIKGQKKILFNVA